VDSQRAPTVAGIVGRFSSKITDVDVVTEPPGRNLPRWPEIWRVNQSDLTVPLSGCIATSYGPRVGNMTTPTC
jgi:hypothetical protein